MVRLVLDDPQMKLSSIKIDHLCGRYDQAKKRLRKSLGFTGIVLYYVDMIVRDEAASFNGS